MLFNEQYYQEMDFRELYKLFLAKQRELRIVHKKLMARTVEEMEFEKKFKEFIKRPIWKSIFIGIYQVDFFIPSLGVYVEIDGSIHNKSFKAKIDLQKMTYLSRLGLKPVHYMNFKVMRHFRQIIREFEQIPELDKAEEFKLVERVLIRTVQTPTPYLKSEDHLYPPVKIITCLDS